MRKTIAALAALIPFFVAAPVSAHHMAEGIVSDDIYEMIDQNLETADSPHLDLDLSSITTMGTVAADDLDDVLLGIAEALPGQGTQVESSITVEISGPVDGVYTITIIENVGRGESQQEVPTLP